MPAKNSALCTGAPRTLGESNRKLELEQRRLKPSSSMRAEVSTVVSRLSSSFRPSGERRDQATTWPTELLETLPKLHLRDTERPATSGTITGADGAGGCGAAGGEAARSAESDA
ncbi:hypothetical protein EYF80_043659 [Liparis tanakae]|uniref:Uncharacterized protein n=1 Tax=Liparis tanakae TaxID=230148 RepID=A0A4Z2G012_9TELE|nr:hypothetical protein EYF80_043659 [Liparis tanakae]